MAGGVGANGSGWILPAAGRAVVVGSAVAVAAAAARTGWSALAAEELAGLAAAIVAAIGAVAVAGARAAPSVAAVAALAASVALAAVAVLSPPDAAFASVLMAVPALAVAAACGASARALAAVVAIAGVGTSELLWHGDLQSLSLLAAAALVAAGSCCRRPAAPSRQRSRVVACAAALAAGCALAATALAPSTGIVAVAGWTAACIGATACAAGGLSIALAGVAAAGVCAAALALPSSVAAGSFVLAQRGGEAVVVDRATMLRAWRAGDGVRALAGPDRCGDALLAVLAHAGTRTGDRLLVLGDEGRLAAALAALPERVVDAVDDRPGAEALRGAMASVGLVAAESASMARAGSFDRRLRRLGPGARQAIALAALPTARGWSASAAAQRELARVAVDGIVLQPVALDVVDAGVFAAWLAAVVEMHAWVGVYCVGADAVVVAAAAPPTWAAEAWPEAVRWLGHRAHLGDPLDLDAAFLGAVDAARLGEAARTAPAALLAAVCRRAPSDAPPRAASVFAAWRAQCDALDAAVARLGELAETAADRAAANALAARFLPIGAPRAELQAALGLVGEAGAPLVEPARAARRAAAIAPFPPGALPPVLRGLPRPAAARGPLEDLAALPPPARLAELAVGDGPLAIALRARFPSPCARALVAALAAAPLPPEAMSALRQLADPFVLAAAADALPRPRLRELIGVWRGGLPMPTRLVELARGEADDRRALAVALAGRREPSCAPALAELLVADEPEVLELAAVALRLQFEGRVPFDPASSLSVRRMAADQVRSLHNRAP